MPVPEKEVKLVISLAGVGVVLAPWVVLLGIVSCQVLAIWGIGEQNQGRRGLRLVYSGNRERGQRREREGAEEGSGYGWARDLW